MGCNLPAQLTSDRSAAPGDEHLLALHIAEDRIQIHLDRISAQQVLHIHIAELAHIDLAVHQLIHARQRPQLTVRLLCDLNDLLDGTASGRRDRNDDLIDLMKRRILDDLVPAAHNLDALDISSPFLRIVIDDAPDPHGAEIAGIDLLDDRVAGIARSYNHNGNTVVLIMFLPSRLSGETIGKTACHREAHQQEGIEKVITLGHTAVKQ